MPKTLHLVIPGLLGPWPESHQSGFPQPRAPALERLLGRATIKQLAVTGGDATLFELFGVPVSPGQDLPVAAVTRLADAGEPDCGWWLRADPVHLRADLHQVLLFDARFLDISAAEAGSLVAEFNQVFAADGWTLEAPHPARWYLRLDNNPGVHTYPLREAIGRNVNPLLPYGESAPCWRSLLTEIQMLFHSAGVNRERESRGQLSINSVWFWGGGELPAEVRSPTDGIYARDLLVRGLARLVGMAIDPLPDRAGDWQAAAKNERGSLVVLEETRYDRVDHEPHAWVEHVQALERDWFAPCLAMLRGKGLDALYLYPGNGRIYSITPRDLRRFWQRARPLTHCLSQVND